MFQGGDWISVETAMRRNAWAGVQVSVDMPTATQLMICFVLGIRDFLFFSYLLSLESEQLAI